MKWWPPSSVLFVAVLGLVWVAAWAAPCAGRHQTSPPVLRRRPGSPPHHPPAPRALTPGDENPGRIAADIVFVLQEKPHPVFRRDGNDLVYTHRWGGARGVRGAP